ncbi:MAG: fibronectin type III domain-containing protein [Bacteroidales bacterium]|nr:fibronectin type III domain-containing protein [Bacteroidales bacterium]
MTHRHLPLILMALMCLPMASMAQSFSYSCDFEDATENLQWTFSNGTFTNQWVIGSATNNGGASALYVSDDSGTSHHYTVATSAQMVIAMRSLDLPLAEYTLTFDWLCKAQKNSDYMRVALVSDDDMNGVEAASSISGITNRALPTGWMALDGGNRLSDGSTTNWTSRTSTFGIADSGRYWLVFVWVNNPTGGNQPPAAVDNISITQNACMSPAGLQVTDVLDHEVTLSWAGMVGAKYALRYSTVNDSTTAQDYAMTDSTATSVTLNGLRHGTTYYAWVRSICNQTWVPFVSFTTQISCAKVINARTEMVNRNSALIRWDFGTGALNDPTEVIMSYSHDSAQVQTISTTENYAVLNGLSATTLYNVELRTVCGIDTATAVHLSFTTAGCLVAIGDGRDSSYTIGPSDNYVYSTYEYIYTAAELNMPAGYINSLVLDCAKAPVSPYSGLNVTYNFYMGNTSKLNFTSNEDIIDGSILTLVATRTTHYVLGENVINFTTPFYYDGVSSIVIVFTQSIPGWSTDWSTAPYFRYTAASNSGFRFHNDDYPEFASPLNGIPTGGYSTPSRVSNRPNIKFPMSCDDTSSCYAPLVFCDSVDANTVSVRWGNMGDSTLYRVEYHAIGSTAWHMVLDSANTDEAEIADLQPNTAYEVRVSTLCPGNDEPVSSTIPVRTLCGVYNFPFSEYFDSPENLECWNIGRSTYTTSYNRSISSYFSGDGYIVLPEINSDYYGVQLNFDMRSSSTTPYAVVGTVTDANNPDSTFVPLSGSLQLATTNEYNTFEVPIDYTDTAEVRLAIRVVSHNSYVYIDNVRLINPPTCFKVSNVQVRGLGASYASVSWTDTVNASPIAWAVKVGDSTYIADFNPCRITGLDSNHTYNVTVSAICSVGDTAEPSTPTTFTTLAHSPASLPFNEDFENTATYGAWEVYTYSGNNKWCMGTAANNGGTHGMYISSNNGLTHSYNNSNSSYSWAYRDFSLDPGNYLMSFDWIAYGESTYDYLRVALIPSSTSFSYSDWTTTALPTGAISLDGGSKLNLSSEWQTQNVSFDITDQGLYRLAFFWRNDYSAGSDPAGAIDNIRMRLNTCPSPINVTVNNITATTAELNWVPVGSESKWIVTCGSIVDTAWVSHFNFDSLEPSTTYQFTVTAACDVDDFSYPVSAKATTLCQAIENLPYTYGFEDATAASSSGTINPCYDLLGNSSSPYPTSNAHSGNYAMRLNSSSTNYNYLVLPEIVTPIDSLELSFYAASYSSTTPVTLSIGIIGDVSRTASYMQLFTVTLTSTDYEEHIFDFNNLGALYGRIAIAVQQGSSATAYIDDIRVGLIPPCPRVSGLGVSSITTHEATVQWTLSDQASAWIVEYSKYPIVNDEDRYRSVVSTNGSASITGLDSNSVYYVRVKADCGLDGSSEYAYTQFATLPYMPTVPPFTDGFEDSVSYAGWVLANNENDGRTSTIVNYSRWRIGSAINNGGTHALYVSPTTTDSATYSKDEYANIFAYREFLFTADNYIVNYDYNVGGNSSDYLRVAVVPVGTTLTPNTSYSAWSLPSSAIVADSGWSTYSTHGWQTHYARVNIQREGRYYLVFFWRNSSSSYTSPTPPGACIDNVSVKRSNCPAPEGIIVQSAQGSEANLRWQGGLGQEWIVGYGSHNYSTVDSSYTITGLSPQTQYTFNLRAICGPADTSAVATTIFTTPCPVLSEDDLPLVDDFEDYNASATSTIDPCWLRTVNSGRSYPFVNTFYHHSGGKSLQFPVTQNCHLVLPDIDVELHRLQLSFYTRSLSDVGVMLQVGIMSDPNDTSTFQLVTSVRSDTVWRATNVYFNAYNGPAGRIVLHGPNISAYVDSLVVDIAHGCPVPTNIVSSDIADTSAMLSWSGMSERYHVQYRPTDSPNWVDAGTVNIPQLFVGGLMPVSTYEVRVSGLCGNEESDWSMSSTFGTTEAANGCNPVLGLQMGSVASLAAMVEWSYPDSVQGARFEVRVGATGFDREAGPYIDSIVSDTSVIVEGLTIYTSYEVYCRVLCADGATSYWQGPVSFTTLGIDDVASHALVSLYPNPASGEATVSVSGATGRLQIEVSDLNGRCVLRTSMLADEGNKRLNIGSLAHGAYFVHIYGSDVNSVRKLIVR